MFLLIDKPKGITSHGVIDKIREISGEKRVGHAGTLDPNATGLLIVGVGRESTKKLGQIARKTTKVYQTEVFLGEERETDDTEGEVIKKYQNFKKPKLQRINKVLAEFVGEQDQVPPVYSAVKIKGKPAYKRARKGQLFKLKPRRITIYSIRLVSYKFPILKIEVGVSSGTYIRAFARDLGKKLGCGAYLKNLRRIRIGEFEIETSVPLSKLNAKNWEKFMIEW